MYSLTLHTNAIIRSRDSGIHYILTQSLDQSWNRKQQFWKQYVSLRVSSNAWDVYLAKNHKQRYIFK